MIKNKNLHINFYNYEGTNIPTEKFSNEIIKAIKKDKNQNVLGFNKISYMKSQLLYIFGNQNILESKIDIKKNNQIEKAIVKFLSKFQKKLSLKYKPIRIYVYPWFPDKKTSKEFGGVNAIATYFTVIHLYIDYKNFTFQSLEETLAHELNHLCFYQAHDNSFLNIKESIIAEGLAEHFRESFVGGKVALWSKALNAKKVKEIMPKLVPYLESYDRDVYNNIFYNEGEFKRWTGYSVGYVLVKKMLDKIKKSDWNTVMKMPIDEFFR
jgi:uncharacterized protein YjaZ